MKRNWPALTMSNTKTYFKNVMDLKGKSARGAWYPFVEVWAFVHISYSRAVKADNRKIFTSKNREKGRQMAGNHMNISGTESHKS